MRGAVMIGAAVIGVVTLLGLGPALRAAEEVEVHVVGVTADPVSRSPIVVLEDLKGKESLPIWIGLSEARAILMALEGVNPPRPLTHDLAKNLLVTLDSRIARITVTELRNNTFFATVTVERGAGGDETTQRQLDSRPSDAIALALRFKAPIYVNAALFHRFSSRRRKGKRATGPVQRRLGLSVQDLTPALAEAFELDDASGVLIAAVGAASPASRRGIKRGDVIVQVDGKNIATVEELNGALRGLPNEGDVTLMVRRGAQTLQLTLQPRPDSNP